MLCHVTVNLHGLRHICCILMANNEETFETNASALELATALVDEDNIEELEPILQDSLDEINEKEFLCPECNKKYKIETGRNRHVLNK